MTYHWRRNTKLQEVNLTGKHIFAFGCTCLKLSNMTKIFDTCLMETDDYSIKK